MYKILVADDEKPMLTILEGLFKKEGYSVLTATDGKVALKIYEDNKDKIDICLFDVMMPYVDGISLCQIVKEENENIPVIIMTARDTEDCQLSGFDNGADDYIAKPFSLKVLLKRVERQLRLEQKRNSEVYELIYRDIKLNTLSYTVYDKGIEANLTPTEFKVLRLLMLTPREVLTIEELSKKISIDGEYVPPRVIGNYISNIRSKLAYSGNIIHNIRGVGYKIE